MNEYLQLMKSELMVVLIIFILLFIKLGKGLSNSTLLSLVQLLLLLNVGVSFGYNETGRIFSGMFVHNELVGFQKGILALAVYLISLLCSDWLKEHEHMPEFFMLMLSALLGMFFLVSSDHLLMFYLSLELASIPVAAMANFDLERRKSSEAAMKMVMSSALASGIMLFGISLIYGVSGSLDFATIWGTLRNEPLHIMAFVFLFSAFAFKLSVVPFHFWTADVYEGSPVAVTAFLSVVSKGAVSFALISILYKLFPNLSTTWYSLVVVLSLMTMLVGNFFALRQDNFLRFLAFSSITQVGFILLALSGQNAQATSSITYFMLVYVLSNLAAFGVASVLRTQVGVEKISQLKGLYKSSPILAWTLSLGLFSLAGIPPAAGFFGKLFLLMAGAAKGNYWFITVAALNMIVSLYYYLRVVRLVFSAPEGEQMEGVKILKPVALGLTICSAGVILAGVVSWIYDHICSMTM
ncbi:MAG TPA: NADH-quinone oxidoreductase subunit N [Chitinophagaceae bacterium]|nr:NADH-quinone oxidoreductase subunit N [Chitinophagaceae bacterium]